MALARNRAGHSLPDSRIMLSSRRFAQGGHECKLDSLSYAEGFEMCPLRSSFAGEENREPIPRRRPISHVGPAG